MPEYEFGLRPSRAYLLFSSIIVASASSGVGDHSRIFLPHNMADSCAAVPPVAVAARRRSTTGRASRRLRIPRANKPWDDDREHAWPMSFWPSRATNRTRRNLRAARKNCSQLAGNELIEERFGRFAHAPPAAPFARGPGAERRGRPFLLNDKLVKDLVRGNVAEMQIRRKPARGVGRGLVAIVGVARATSSRSGFAPSPASLPPRVVTVGTA